MERFVIIITKRSILEAAAVLDPPLMKHEFMHWSKLSYLISISRLNKPNLALRRPNAHSFPILADNKRYPKGFSRWSLLPLANSFIKYGNSVYARSPKMHIGTSGLPTITFLHWSIVPLRRLWRRFEIENILASCTLPGHLINTSIKQ